MKSDSQTTTRPYSNKLIIWMASGNELAIRACFKIEDASIKLRQPYDPDVYARSKDWLLWKSGL